MKWNILGEWTDTFFENLGCLFMILCMGSCSTVLIVGTITEYDDRKHLQNWKSENDCRYYNHSESEYSSTWIWNCKGDLYTFSHGRKRYISKAPKR